MPPAKTPLMDTLELSQISEGKCSRHAQDVPVQCPSEMGMRFRLTLNCRGEAAQFAPTVWLPKRKSPTMITWRREGGALRTMASIRGEFAGKPRSARAKRSEPHQSEHPLENA